MVQTEGVSVVWYLHPPISSLSRKVVYRLKQEDTCVFDRLNKISNISMSTIIFGLESSLPIFIAPAALARLGHPDGEMNLTRAAGEEGILQGVSQSLN